MSSEEVRAELSTEKSAVLIVEDDPDILEQMRWGLGANHIIHEAKDRRTAVALMRREVPPLVLLDLGLPPAVDDATEGLATLQEILQFAPRTKIIVATGNSGRANAVAEVQRGTYDFIQNQVQLDLIKYILEQTAHLYCF